MGKRGPKKRPDEENRQPVNARVAPETLKALDEYAEAMGVNRGRAVDEAARLLRKKRPSR